MKLVVMEQGLAAKLREVEAMAAPVTGTAPANPADLQKQQAAMVLQQQQRKRQIQDQIKIKQKELQDLQKQLTQPMAESRLTESEVQQAQVVLASQDMVDQVQKMIEQVTSMQFKDLPALVDQVKNQMGPDQAVSFNQEVTGALTNLTQNLQGSKTQLEGALGVVTGQAPTIPGQDMAAAPAAEMGAEELPPPPEGEEEVAVDAEVEEPAGGSVNDLGRKRR
jgi:alanyl-tRNA synthetase